MIHTDLMTRWPHLWTPQRSEALADEFCYVPAGDLRLAIHRHAHDATQDNRNIPLGQFPPTTANIEAHLGQITAERIRQRLEDDQRQRDLESHQTYQEMLGQRDATTRRGQFWGEQIRLQMARAAEIRKALERRYRLDYTDPRDHQLVMQTLEVARYKNPVVDATSLERGPDGLATRMVMLGLVPVEQALEAAEGIAERLDLTRRQVKAA